MDEMVKVQQEKNMLVKKKPEKGLKRGPVPMSDKGTKTMWVRLPRELADIVEKRARMTKTSTSSIIRDIVRSELCR